MVSLLYSLKKKQKEIEFDILDISIMKTKPRTASTHPLKLPKGFISQFSRMMQFDLHPLPSLFASLLKLFQSNFESVHVQFLVA